MKILNINYSEIEGGAALHCNRLHQGFLKKKIQSYLLVNKKISNNSNVLGPKNQKDLFFIFLKKIFIKLINFILKKNIGFFFSVSFFKSNILEKINNLNPKIVNLFWVNNEMLSIEQIKMINKPLVWTFVDMWPFLGTEHYSLNPVYFRKNYKVHNKNFFYYLNKWVWERKKKNFNFDFEIVAISKWLAKFVKKSIIFKKKKVHIIYPGLDFKNFKKINKKYARKFFNLSEKSKYILFISSNGTGDVRKGFQILLKSLNYLKTNNVVLIIVGKLEYLDSKNCKFPYINFNKIPYDNQLNLIRLYSACDLLVAPSTLEAFGQVALEAASCNTPAVAFKNTGLADIIKHKVTGYLANFLDEKDFAKGIDWCLNDKNSLDKNIRTYVKNKFDIKITVKKYLQLYKSLYDQRICKT
jgi:glycosyltransferase involved in cell wall biosynthesis